MNHPIIIAGKMLAVLVACGAVWLVCYAISQEGESAGVAPELLPGREPLRLRIFGTPRPEEPADPKFANRP